jgi:hypothetical protein
MSFYFGFGSPLNNGDVGARGTDGPRGDKGCVGCEAVCPPNSIELKFGNPEEIFAAAQDDLKAKMAVDFALALQNNFDFIYKFKSKEIQIKFINLTDQTYFNQILKKSSSNLTLDQIVLLSEEKMRLFVDYCNESITYPTDLVNRENYKLLYRLASLNLVEINEDLLQRIAMQSSLLFCGEDEEYMQLFEMLLMYSNGNFSPKIFDGAGSFAKTVGLNYYANKCRLLEAQIATSSQN